MMKSDGHVLTSRTRGLDHECNEGTDQFIGRHVARQVNSTGAQEMQRFELHLKPDHLLYVSTENPCFVAAISLSRFHCRGTNSLSSKNNFGIKPYLCHPPNLKRFRSTQRTA